jgi:hypothetical protein
VSLRVRVLIVIALVLAIRLPFLNQAIQGDDVYYLAGAEHAQIEPLHPNHTTYVFSGERMDVRGHPHPPLDPWILGGLLAAVGSIREVPFHLAYIALSLIAAISMLSLADRYSSRPLLATLLFCAVPAFVINGNSFEADLPFLAFWMLSIALFVRGHWLGSTLAAGLAALGAYQAVFLTPILGVYLIYEKRRDLMAWLATLAAPVALLAWQVWERLSSGSLPATVLAGYLNSYGLEAVQNKARNAVALVVHLGWLVCPLIVIALMARRVDWKLIVAGICALGAAIYDSNPLFWITFTCGVWLLLFSWKRGFLGAWVLIFFAGALVVFFAGSARYLLPLAAPIAILLANEVNPKIAYAGFGVGLVLALALAYANYEHWNAYRSIAGSLSRDAAQKRVWVNAGWGMQYYMESEGALALLKDRPMRIGEAVVSSTLSVPVRIATPVALLREVEVRPTVPFRLISPSGRSGYSTALGGFLPFEVSNAPIDRIRVETAAEPTLSFIDPKNSAAMTQVVQGIFPDAWSSNEAVVLLKSPGGRAKLVASFFIPANAPAREVKLLLGSDIVAAKTFPGPGAYELSAEVETKESSVTATLRVDKAFRAPPDIRDLGMVVLGIGFR